jgi:hypothetical protein
MPGRDVAQRARAVRRRYALLQPPTRLFDFDPVASALTDVTPTGAPGAILAGALSPQQTMVALPSGDVLLTTQFSNQLREFAPKDAWRPTISSVTPNGGGTLR